MTTVIKTESEWQWGRETAWHRSVIRFQSHQRSAVPTLDWRWSSHGIPSDFSLTPFLHREQIWSQKWQLIGIKAEKSDESAGSIKSESALLRTTSASASGEFKDEILMGAWEDTGSGLWSGLVGRNRADGVAPPPSLSAPLQKVSWFLFLLLCFVLF